MKINRKKQRGATLVSWLIVAGIGILLTSAVIKVAPYYVEFNNVKGLMTEIASEPGIKRASLNRIQTKIEKHLLVNNLRGLEDTYYSTGKYDSAKKGKKKKSPFRLLRMKKGKNNRMLVVQYSIPQPWIGNLSFLIDFSHAVVLGEPDMDVKPPTKKKIKKPRIKLN